MAPHLLCFGAGGLVGWVAGLDADVVLVATLTGMSVSMAAARKLDGLRVSGTITWVSVLMLTAVAMMWGFDFLIHSRLSLPTTVLLWTGAALGLVTVPSTLVQFYERWEMALRWRRSTETVRLATPGKTPMVSIHFPTHAEPPDLVISTLDTLARLDYPDYEVVVIDKTRRTRVCGDLSRATAHGWDRGSGFCMSRESKVPRRAR